jgi:hypothetical protein
VIRRLAIAAALVAVAISISHAGAFFIILHNAAGLPVYVNAEQVDFIGPPAGESDKRAKSRVMVYGIWVWVQETPDEIKAAIDKVLKQDTPEQK